MTENEIKNDSSVNTGVKSQHTVEANNKICGSLGFEASEAYRLLRTNVLFSFTQGEKAECKIVGMTSAVKGEGKSLNAINLAYTFALDEKNVLLIECDLRMPLISKRLLLRRAPGLSNVLVGLCPVRDAIQRYEGEASFSVMTAGETPPNPSELLGSDRMKVLLTMLREKFDYIIMDLPPVTVVADALVVSKFLDGMMVVVRKNYTDSRYLDDTVEKLKFVDANILGFIYNCNESGKKSYRYKRYGSRYGYKYGYKYGYNYGYNYGYGNGNNNKKEDNSSN